jgi:D-galactose 1-dehydrogenase
MAVIRIAVVGLGKIAHDQHLPAIANDPNFRLTATVEPNGAGIDGVPHYQDLTALLSSGSKIDAVVLSTPPHVRYDLAAQALAHGAHIFLEKPPGATLSEVDALVRCAQARHVTIFTAWHSRFAAGVEPARKWLAHRQIRQVEIVWREDVRKWHPGQQWIWEQGGLGVFDPGINALSIATRILPRNFFLRSATLFVPANRAAPIAANVTLHDTKGAPISMDLDWRQTGPQTWDIAVETDMGICKLTQGGAVLNLPNGSERGEDREYACLYERFAELIQTGQGDVDTYPLKLVADAFLCGQRAVVEPFHW